MKGDVIAMSRSARPKTPTGGRILLWIAVLAWIAGVIGFYASDNLGGAILIAVTGALVFAVYAVKRRPIK